MSNKDIARAFNTLALLMELHDENPFKIRSYHAAYRTLRKWEQPLGSLGDAELAAVPGVGKAIAGKIRELLDTGRMATLEKYKAMTPPGVVDMLDLQGFGPKKIRQMWQELGAESLGELHYACVENRLVGLKGFGKKTQDELLRQIEYLQRNRHLFHFARLDQAAEALLAELAARFPEALHARSGALRRAVPVLARIELLSSAPLGELAKSGLLSDTDLSDKALQGLDSEGLPVCIWPCTAADFGSKQFRHTASADFLQAFLERYPGQDFRHLAEEAAVFAQVGLPYLPPELREDGRWLAQNPPARLIETGDLRGIVHAHSTYSDGLHTLRDMALYCREQGYAYLAITDHSQAAFYANGLSPERVLAQWAEIDALNAELAPFRIFKGIEADILADGSLDYGPELLAGFELVIASVHSNLKMDAQKATERLLRAIENPHTDMLGHPTGRLLLSRPGYPIDHARIIDACAANGVAIEVNAHPYRLDLDWTWVPYALEKGLRLSINPDAHSREGIHDVRYGIAAARKGGLRAEDCLNALDAAAFVEAIKRR